MAEGVVPSRSEAALNDPVSTVAAKAASPAILSEMIVIWDIPAQIMCQDTILCADLSNIYPCHPIRKGRNDECSQRQDGSGDGRQQRHRARRGEAVREQRRAGH